MDQCTKFHKILETKETRFSGILLLFSRFIIHLTVVGLEATTVWCSDRNL